MFEQLFRGTPAEAWAMQLPRSDCTLGQLITRIGAVERMIEALQAFQLRDVAAFDEGRRAEDERQRIPRRLVGRTVAAEVACARGVSPVTGRLQAELASLLVEDLPQLLEALEEGRASLSGVRKVVEQTVVLSAPERREVDGNLASELRGTRLTPASWRTPRAGRSPPPTRPLQLAGAGGHAPTVESAW